MLQIEVNNRRVEARRGETILDACRRNDISIPTLCHLAGLAPTGACRICVVEVEGFRNLVPSCSFPVADGMKIQTHSPRALQARKTIVELLAANHPDDCLYCVRSGSCDLQGLSRELGVRKRRAAAPRPHEKLDFSSPSLVRDGAKCILCGKCVRVCEEVQGVGAIDFVGRGSRARVATAFDAGLNVSSCIHCGQCLKVCPTGAIVERRHIKQLRTALDDPEMTVVVQHAPAVSVSIAEELGLPPGLDVDGALVTALRRIGFDRVFDTAFAADLTIMEEAAELVHRIQSGGPLPMFTSCSPGWVGYVEQFYPQLLPNLSTCKSPQQMLGAVVKSFWAEREGLAPERVFSVAIMPCTAKKLEAARPEHATRGVPDVDAVLTTREAAQLIRRRGLDLGRLPPDTADTPFGDRSSAGKLFAATGGVMEAALRTAHHALTGEELPALELQSLRGLDGVKTARVDIAGRELGVAVVSGTGNARALIEEIRAGRDDLHFVEVMACPGGCIAGGGQPLGASPAALQARMSALYALDREAGLRVSHRNRAVARLYDELLGAPLSEASHHLLHTHYRPREGAL